MRSDLDQTRPLTVELAALCRLKMPHNYGENRSLLFFWVVFRPIRIIQNISCNKIMHKRLDQLEFLRDRTIDYNVDEGLKSLPSVCTDLYC